MSFRRPHLLRLFIVTLAASLFAAGVSAGHAEPPLAHSSFREMPVNFTATSLSHDDDKQTVTALGNVELAQGEQILRADKLVYYLAEDKVTAIGNVSLLDNQGNVHFAEYIELRNKMKDGFVQGLLTLLADGSRFTAVEGKRENDGTRTTMVDATYTVCKVCEADPHPLWQIKASRVVHDAVNKDVKYKNARLEVFDVPVIYSPIFSHPDPSQKRKSGFLRPEYGWSTLLGTHIKAGYYYDIAPDKDMTLEVRPTTLAGTLVMGEWRQRFEHGSLKVNGSTANSDRVETDGSISTSRQRGHIAVDGLFDINDNWRSGLNIARASDKQYLNLYDISKDNVLTSQIYAERFSGRDYSRISAYNFQDLRLGTRPVQPDILPLAEHTMIGRPGSLWGGRWQADFSALGLDRSNGRQSVQRGSADLGWERRIFSPTGLATTLRLGGQGDVYAVQDSDAARLNPALDNNPTITRSMGTAGFVSSYPMVRRFAKAQAVIEPVAGVNLSSRVSGQNNEIPNEDSIDVRFDTSNLFQESRYPGLDRREDGGRTNYGLKTGWYSDSGRYGKAFIGQSYRFSGDRIFPQGSGLENRASDVVGQVGVGLAKYLDADYRFQLDNETLAIRRHEVQAGGGNDTFRLNGRYLYTEAVAGTGFNESRQQIQMGGTYNITKTWQFGSSALMDVGNQPGLRNSTTGITYSDECFTFALQGSRNVADEASGNDETRLTVRIGLTSIGGFSGPQVPFGSANQNRK